MPSELASPTAFARKAVFLDLDGTFLDSRNAVSPANLDAARECLARGHVLAFATARPLRTARELLPEGLHGCYLALCNGAWILRDGETVARTEIPRARAATLVEALARAGLALAVEAGDAYYTDGELFAAFRGPHHPLSAWPADADVCKIVAFRSTGFDPETLRPLLPPGYAHVVTDGGTVWQIAAGACTKAHACQWIAEREGIPRERTYAFGDDYNDIPMLDWAGTGIAMGNGVAELKATAKFITSVHDADGVAEGIWRHVLQTD